MILEKLMYMEIWFQGQLRFYKFKFESVIEFTIIGYRPTTTDFDNICWKIQHSVRR